MPILRLSFRDEYIALYQDMGKCTNISIISVLAKNFILEILKHIR